MWQCTSCDYQNEGLDEVCQKCGAPRVAPVQLSAEPPPPAAPSTPPAVAAAEAPKKRDGTNAVTVLLIIACVLAIGAVGYLAWQRGLIGRLTGTGAPAGQAAPAADEMDIWAEAPPAPARFRRATQSARQAIDRLLATADSLSVEVSEEGVLSSATDEALTALAADGEDLVWQYREFERQVAAANDPQLGEYAQFVRDNFELAMLESLEVAGSAYSRDRAAAHPVYLLSDNYADAADEFGLLSSERIREVWGGAVHARRQRELDLQYTEQYNQLAARVEALHTIHSAFNEQLAAMPPYKVRAGVLGKDAKDLLELLGALATKIEEMVLEFEQYKATLAPLEESDRMRDYYTQFESLAQTDHLYAFEEIYKIYEQDKELTHPVYATVAGHYQFALDHWSEAALRYEEIYRASEEKWAETWAAE